KNMDGYYFECVGTQSENRSCLVGCTSQHYWLNIYASSDIPMMNDGFLSIQQVGYAITFLHPLKIFLSIWRASIPNNGIKFLSLIHFLKKEKLDKKIGGQCCHYACAYDIWRAHGSSCF
ncbi:hypothetical protein ACJX0J_009329, partial [Zea mays]